jgi:hypothetical protein
VTVREWIDARQPAAPVALREGVQTALGPDLEADATLTTDVCIRAAVRGLQTILADRAFDRDGALDLLVVDALATYAYEYASTVGGASHLDRAAVAGMRQLGALASHV